MTGTIWSKFFWSDWLSDPGVRACSYAARGLWMDLLCIAASSDPVGYVSVNGRDLGISDIARVTGGDVHDVESLLSELESRGVFSRDRHNRIFSRRLLRDAKRRATAVKNGKKGGNPNLRKEKEKSQSVNGLDNHGLELPLKADPGISQIPESSNKSSVFSEEENTGAGAPPSDCPKNDLFNGCTAEKTVADPKKELFDRGKAVLGSGSGGFVARLLRSIGNENDPKSIALARARIEEASTKANPREWIGRIISNPKNTPSNGPVDWRSVL